MLKGNTAAELTQSAIPDVPERAPARVVTVLRIVQDWSHANEAAPDFDTIDQLMATAAGMVRRQR